MATAKKAAAKKSPAKKTPAKKTTTARKTTAAKKAAPARKTGTAAKKAISAKKATAVKKAAAKKRSPARKAPVKSVAELLAGGGADAVTLLTADHRDVRQLFEQYEQLAVREADAAERKQLAEQVCKLLEVHALVEEEIFYPAAREALSDDDEDLLDEAQVEHDSAKDLIAQIRAMEPDQDLYDAKVKVLGEYVQHHVEEEETEMFPKCRRAKMDLDELGERLAERRSMLLGNADATAGAGAE